MRSLDDDSIDLIATDPPYFNVKSDEWDRQWKTEADFFDWLELIIIEYARVLKPLGAMYLFCGPYLAAKTEVLIGKHLNVMNHLIWVKKNGRHSGCNASSLRKYFPQTERIIFSESLKKTEQEFHYEDLLAYMRDAMEQAGIAPKDLNEITGTQMSSHWSSRSQFTIPSEENYKKLQARMPALDKAYKEYLEAYQGIGKGNAQRRRFFDVKKGQHTDIFNFNTIAWYKGKHPCEKPLDLMSHIIEASSEKDALVLDTFVGSGSTAIAALNLGRRFIGCEFGDAEYQSAVDRIERQTAE